MKRLAMVRLERGIDVNGMSSVTELTNMMGLVLETDGSVLLIHEYACIHCLPFSRVIDSHEERPGPVELEPIPPTLDSMFAYTKGDTHAAQEWEVEADNKQKHRNRDKGRKS